MTKRLISWILTLAMCLSLVSIPAMADGVNTPSVTEAIFYTETTIENVFGTDVNVVHGFVRYKIEHLNPGTSYLVDVYQDTEGSGNNAGFTGYQTSAMPDASGVLSGTFKLDSSVTTSIVNEIKSWYLGIRLNGVEGAPRVAVSPLYRESEFEPTPVIVYTPEYNDPKLGDSYAKLSLGNVTDSGEESAPRIITVPITGQEVMAQQNQAGSTTYSVMAAIGIPKTDGAAVTYRTGWIQNGTNVADQLNVGAVNSPWAEYPISQTVQSGEGDAQKTYGIVAIGDLSPEFLSEHKGETFYVWATAKDKNYLYQVDLSGVTLATVTFDANGADEGGDETYMLHGDTELVSNSALVESVPAPNAPQGKLFGGWYLSTDTNKAIVVGKDGKLVTGSSYTVGATYKALWLDPPAASAGNTKTSLTLKTHTDLASVTEGKTFTITVSNAKLDTTKTNGDLLAITGLPNGVGFTATAAEQNGTTVITVTLTGTPAAVTAEQNLTMAVKKDAFDPAAEADLSVTGGPIAIAVEQRTEQITVQAIDTLSKSPISGATFTVTDVTVPQNPQVVLPSSNVYTWAVGKTYEVKAQDSGHYEATASYTTNDAKDGTVAINMISKLSFTATFDHANNTTKATATGITPTIPNGSTVYIRTYESVEGISVPSTFNAEGWTRCEGNDYSVDITNAASQKYLTMAVVSDGKVLAFGTAEISKPNTHSVAVTTTGNGTLSFKVNSNAVTPVDGKIVNLDSNDQVEVTITPNPGYALSQLKVGSADVTSQVQEGKYTITVPNSETSVTVSVSATFAAKSYNVTIASGITNGSVNFQPTTKTTAKTGETVALTVTPQNGYEITSVSYQRDDVQGSTTVQKLNDTYSFVMPAANVTVSATFAAKSYNVSVANGITNGSVNFQPTTKTTATTGETVALTVTPSDGYEVTSVSYRKAGEQSSTTVQKSNDTYSFVMPAANVTVSATFGAISYSVEIDRNITGGSVTANPTTYNVGGSVKLTVRPNTDYELVSLTVDGNNVTSQVSNNEYTASNLPAKNIPVTATFKEKQYDVTLNLDGGSLTATGWVENQGVYTRTLTKSEVNKNDFKSPVPTKAEVGGTTYTFTGWKVGNTTDTAISAKLLNAAVDGKLALTAIWSTEVPISYANVTENEKSVAGLKLSFKADEGYRVPNLANRTEDGVTTEQFLGWTVKIGDTTSDGLKTNYPIPVNTTERVTLTANWKSLKHNVTSIVMVDGATTANKATFDTTNRENVEWVATQERSFRVTPPKIDGKILTGVTAIAKITEIAKDPSNALTVALEVAQNGGAYEVTLPTLNNNSDVEYSIDVTLGYVTPVEVKESDTAPSATGTTPEETNFLEKFTNNDSAVVQNVETTTTSAQTEMKKVLANNDDATLYTEEQAAKAGSDLKDSVVAALQSKISDTGLGLEKPEGMTDQDFNNLKNEAKKARAEELYNALLEKQAIGVQEVSTLEMNVKQISYDATNKESFNMTVGLDLAMQGQVGVDTTKLEGVNGLSDEMKEALAEVQSQNIGDSLNMSKLLKDTETTDAKIDVTIPVPDTIETRTANYESENNSLWVVHIIDDKGNYELLPAEIKDGVLTFKTPSFSDFVIYLSNPFKATLKHEGSPDKPYLSLTDALKNAKANDTIVVKSLTDAEKSDGVKPTSAVSNVKITADVPAQTKDIVPKDTFKSNSVGSTIYTPSTQEIKDGEGNPTGEFTLTVTQSTMSSGGGGGGGGAVANVIVAKAANGRVKASNTSATTGEKVTVTMTPDSGYVADTLTVKDKNGTEIAATRNSDGTYTFTMPAASLFPVTVTGTFKAVSKTGFVDVDDNAYYAAAVEWAVNHDPQITNGTDSTHFSPEMICTRGQLVTFLWRAAGTPEPVATTSVFTDTTDPNAYYYKAVLWATENGVTKGTSATTFSPDDIVTRGQVVTFLYRYEKATSAAGNTFTDVAADAYYAPSVNWAYVNGITNGTSATTFSPNDDCTRAQIVTFLYRDFLSK